MWFFRKKNTIEEKHYSEKEMKEIMDLYQMLVKMKSRRPDLDVKKMMDDLYPNNGITYDV